MKPFIKELLAAILLAIMRFPSILPEPWTAFTAASRAVPVWAASTPFYCQEIGHDSLNLGQVAQDALSICRLTCYFDGPYHPSPQPGA